MTIVLFGSITDPSHYGDDASNGGYKAQSLMVKLLRQHGVEAYRVTRDGGQVPWLIDPQPAVSIDQARAWRDEGRDLRVATTWIAAAEFLALAGDGPAYFYDQEMAYTTRAHFATLQAWTLSALRLATHNRMTQAWYMATFGVTPLYIPEWSDSQVWHPGDEGEVDTVGYMNEGPHTARHIQHIQQAVPQARLMEIRGTEQDVRDAMRKCDLFLSMNTGKHPLWGEGCPRAAQEAMHAGCVVVAYDVHGNREYLHDGYNGVLVPNGDWAAMASAVAYLLRNPDHKEAMCERSLTFAREAWSEAGRWPLLHRWLEL